MTLLEILVVTFAVCALMGALLGTLGVPLLLICGSCFVLGMIMYVVLRP